MSSDFKVFLERLKDAPQCRIHEVVVAVTGWTLTRSGDGYRTKEHDSLMMWPDDGRYVWYSKGSQAGARGDVIEWLMHWGRMPDFRQAVDYLCERAGMRYEWNEEQTAAYKVAKVKWDALTVMADYLHRILCAHEAALAYAEGRGWTLDDEEGPGTIRRAKLGFWDGDRAALIGELNLYGIDVTLDPVKGILNMPSGMLVYPHFERGRCVYLSARAIGEKRHWNPPTKQFGERQPYYNFLYHGHVDEIVVVEGQADAVTWGQWGVASVASCGLSSPKWLELLGELKKKHGRVVLNIDNEPDKDGDGWRAVVEGVKAAERVLGPAAPVLQLPRKDANDCLVQGWTKDSAIDALVTSPMMALWYAHRWQDVPPEDVEASKRYAFELIASLMPYDYAANAKALADAMGRGNPEPMRVSELNGIVRAIKRERDLASMGVEEAKPERERPRLTQNPLDRFDDELPEAVRDKLLAQSRDHEGHARCVQALHGEKVAFVPQWGWLAYNGRNWDREGAEHLVEMYVVETLKRRRHLAVQNELEGLVSATACSRRNVVSVQKMLEKLVLCTTSDFDKNPNLLNCANGAVDLRRGTLVEHDPAHRFTYCLPTPYVPDADYSDWLLFVLASIGHEDKAGHMHVEREFVDWLQMAVGYSLTGHTSENCLFYLYGPTRSGKGTFTQTLLRLLGQPLSMSLDFNVLTAQRNEDSQNFALAPFKPCRFLAGSEPGKYERFNEAKMKMLTGDDPVRASFKQRDHFEYVPQFKIWLSANWEFNADPNDEAVWGRARIIHFPNSYLGREDKHLKHKLQSPDGLKGVLAWAVAGAMAWYGLGADGLQIPAAVAEIVYDQRHKQDFLELYFDENCTVHDPEDVHSFTPIKQLYSSYTTWSKEMGVTAMKQRAFIQALKAKGYRDTRQRIGQGAKQYRGYVGIALDESLSEEQMSLFSR